MSKKRPALPKGWNVFEVGGPDGFQVSYYDEGYGGSLDGRFETEERAIEALHLYAAMYAAQDAIVEYRKLWDLDFEEDPR